MDLKTFVISVALFYIIQTTDGGITDLWDFCNCYWGKWNAWSDCDSECNGQRVRDREVWLYKNKDGCPFEFTTCATNDMGDDYSRCNEFCLNGGTSNSYSCACITGFYGSCCEFQVNCGQPSTPTNGRISGSTFTYGGTVTYSCNTHYILVNGSTTRTCQLSWSWSGTQPRCAYYNSCSSGPCRNQAICTNQPDDYICSCTSGWSGKNCDIDIQPPVMSQCQASMDFQIDVPTKHIEWTVPTFSDPHGFVVEVESNYPTNNWTFPWGDFTVSYAARKPSNGLTADCLIQIKVRPKPCFQLHAPLNGALICNDWKTDYGQFCKILCHENYTVPRGVNPRIWYVCGASGSWAPYRNVLNCSVSAHNLMSTDGHTIADRYSVCREDDDELKSNFINDLKSSPFSYFCHRFSNDCLIQNVAIKCS